MSEHDETGSVQVAVDTGEAEAKLAAVDAAVAELDGKAAAERADVHVIVLAGAAGWSLSHPGSCAGLGGCAVEEAAGRISQAMCETGGAWTCEVQGAGLMLVERIGD